MKGSIWQCKMRGKKTMKLRCGCCVAQNFKWSERWKEAMKEVRKDYKDTAILSETEK